MGLVGIVVIASVPKDVVIDADGRNIEVALGIDRVGAVELHLGKTDLRDIRRHRKVEISPVGISGSSPRIGSRVGHVQGSCLNLRETHVISCGIENARTAGFVEGSRSGERGGVSHGVCISIDIGHDAIGYAGKATGEITHHSPLSRIVKGTAVEGQRREPDPAGT